MSESEAAEIRRLKKEIAQLTGECDSSNSVNFSRGGARPSRLEMTRSVNAYRDRFGVELICRVLGKTEDRFITNRGNRAAKSRLMSDRAVRE